MLESDADSGGVLSTGYSLEIVGNKECDLGATQADQCCFTKVALKHALTFAKAEEFIKKVLPKNAILYTTMDQCDARLSGLAASGTRSAEEPLQDGACWYAFHQKRRWEARNDATFTSVPRGQYSGLLFVACYGVSRKQNSSPDSDIPEP